MDENKDGENAITYETFRKFQRKEKNNEKLQDLPEDFFSYCVEWINRKKSEFEESRDSSLIREIENVKRLVKDIFDRRRKKILLLALHSVRSKKVSKNLLPEEETFFDKTVKSLRGLEKNLLEKVLEGEKPEESTTSEDEGAEEGEEVDNEEIEEDNEEGESEEEEYEEGVDVERTEIETEEGEKEGFGEEGEIEVEEGMKLVRIKERVDKFMGTDDEEYGPLEEGDLITLPEDVAGLLIEEGKAEETEV